MDRRAGFDLPTGQELEEAHGKLHEAIDDREHEVGVAQPCDGSSANRRSRGADLELRKIHPAPPPGVARFLTPFLNPFLTLSPDGRVVDLHVAAVEVVGARRSRL